MQRRRPLLQHRYEVHTHAVSYKMLKGFWPLEYAPALTQSRTMHTQMHTHRPAMCAGPPLEASGRPMHHAWLCQAARLNTNIAHRIVEKVQGVRNHSCCP